MNRPSSFDCLWLQLGQMEFFSSHGYTVGLPTQPLFQKLATTGLAGADHEAAHKGLRRRLNRSAEHRETSGGFMRREDASR